MNRTAVILRVAFVVLALSAVISASPAPVPAQTDERLVAARRLQREAATAFDAGRAREGIPKAQEALKLRESALGPDHLEVAESAHTLANLLRDTGDYPAARALHERALEIRERVLGPEHAATATSVSDLGTVFLRSGLSGHLLAPIAQELVAYSDVVFIPNDLLLYLPLHALTRRVDGRDRFLAETHVVSYLTQLELLDLLAPAKPRLDAPLLALANPDGSLPGASQEIRALRGVRKTLTALEGDRATKQEFLRLASTFAQIHLATHGVLDPDRPERSYLLVAGPDEASQRLSIGEIVGLSLQRGLAILSACDTAVGEQVPGAALITLAAAFSQAGAEAIVASLRKVDDSATSEFMVTFHRELGGGQAVALHKAQLAVLGRPATAHPFYWAAFILIGAR